MHYYTTKIRLMWHPQGMWGGAEEIMMRHVKARLAESTYFTSQSKTISMKHDHLPLLKHNLPTRD